MNSVCFLCKKIYVTFYQKDRNIPFLYLLRFYLSRFISLLFGCLRLKKISSLYIHSSCIIKCPSHLFVGKNITISRDCYIDALSVQGLVLGDEVYIGRCTTIECTGLLSSLGKGIKIGNRVSLGTHGFYAGAGGLEIGDSTIFGNFVTIHPENHIFSDLTKNICEQGVTHKGIKIGSGCWVGAKVTILDGTIIGNHVVVAAGAVVIGTFPDNVVIGGIPAKIIKKIS